MSTNETGNNSGNQETPNNPQSPQNKDGDKDVVQVTLASEKDPDNIPSVTIDPSKSLKITKLKAGYSGLAFDLMRADGNPLTGLTQIIVYVESQQNPSINATVSLNYEIAANHMQFLVPFASSDWKKYVDDRSEISYIIGASFSDNTCPPAVEGKVKPKRSVFAVRTLIVGRKKRRNK